VLLPSLTVRQVEPIRQSLTTEVTKTLVHSFINCCLDYCNSLLANVSNQLLHRMQVVQYRMLVLGLSQELSTTSVLHELHWLLIRQRLTYKTAVLVYKCLHGLAPSHLAAFRVPTSCLCQSHLGSAVTGQLAVPRTEITYQSFNVNGPAVCNNLLSELHSQDMMLDVSGST